MQVWKVGLIISIVVHYRKYKGYLEDQESAQEMLKSEDAETRAFAREELDLINKSIEQTKELYERGYELGCKGLTIYRDNSRNEQVLSTDSISSFPLEQICFRSTQS